MKQKRFDWPEGKTAAAIVTVDMDAESAILYTHPEAAEQLDVMAHQSYGTRTGVYRLLRLFDKEGIKVTFFVPGFVVDRWPDVVRDVQTAGHEIGHHGYLHEYLTGISADAEERILLRGLEVIERVTGERPVGYRAPGFKLNRWSPGLLAKHGFLYDSSLQDDDVPYRLLSGDDENDPSLVELPVQWALDDFAHYMHLPGIRPGTGISSPSQTLEMWMAELEALAAEGGCFIITIHPFLSGRASRALTIERLIDHMHSLESLWVASASEVAAYAQTVPLERVWHRPIDLVAANVPGG